MMILLVSIVFAEEPVLQMTVPEPDQESQLPQTMPQTIIQTELVTTFVDPKQPKTTTPFAQAKGPEGRQEIAYFIEGNQIKKGKKGEVQNPLPDSVKEWIDANKDQGIFLQEGEKFLVTKFPTETEPYPSTWWQGVKIGFPDQKRITTVENKINTITGAQTSTTVRTTQTLDKDGQVTSVKRTYDVAERNPANEITSSSHEESQDGRNIYTRYTSYSKGSITSTQILANGLNLIINPDNEKVFVDGQEKTIKEVRELLKDNYDAQNALGDAYVATAKGTWWWPKSLSALDFTKLLGVTLRSADQFKGLSAVNSLIKDKQYQDFIENWKDNVRRNYPVNGIGKFLESKICEAPVKKLKEHMVVGEYGAKPKGLIRVSAEKSDPIDTPLGQNLQYIITYHVENPHGEELSFNVWLRNQKENLPVFVDSTGSPLDVRLAPGQTLSRTKRDPIITESTVKFSNYNQICITFHPRIKLYGSSKKIGEFCDQITGYQGKIEDVQEAIKTKEPPKPGEKAQLNKGFI